MFRAFALRFSLRRRTNARNVSLETLYGGQFILSSQLIKPKKRLQLMIFSWDTFATKDLAGNPYSSTLETE